MHAWFRWVVFSAKRTKIVTHLHVLLMYTFISRLQNRNFPLPRERERECALLLYKAFLLDAADILDPQE